MKYIVIKRVLKKDCPPGINSPWSFDKIPSDLWQIWEKKEIEEDVTPDIYFDQMEETVENYSKNYPEYFWDWCTERKDKVYFDILLDGDIYEGNESLEVALYLYNSVDDTCLMENYGHTKTLRATKGEKSFTLKEGIIEKPHTRLRISYQDGNKEELVKRIYPEEAASYFKEVKKASKVEILNSEGEVVLEY